MFSNTDNTDKDDNNDNNGDNNAVVTLSWPALTSQSIQLRPGCLTCLGSPSLLQDAR